MKTMETELQRLDHELYTMYLRSLEIGELKWLPSIRPKKDSYNSLPHVKGVTGHINRLLYDDEENTFSLNGTEIYILLCAVLMHDIGKGAQENPNDKDHVSDHAYDSRRIIVTRWADLGLPTAKVAEIVADICRFHDCPDRVQMEELYTKYYVDQFQRTDPIRGRLLGALLFLGDHMDTTFTRTVPPYLKEHEMLEVVGNFRSKVADVRLDRQHKMIREILDKTCFVNGDIVGQRMLLGDLYRYLDKDIKDKTVGKMSEVSSLYIVAEDALKSGQQIAWVRDELNIMGMPVKDWLIECDEHLFQIYRGLDEEGRPALYSVYALEPIINLDYCLEVLKGICMLSGGIFARRFFQYSELVNFIREEEKKTYKVKCAVRRLSLLLKAEGSCGYVIYYDENNWSFYCEEEQKAGKDKDHKDTVYDGIRAIIERRLERKNG